MNKSFTAIFLFAFGISTYGQQGPTQPLPKELSAGQKEEIVNAVAEKLSRNYIIPETAEKYAAFIKKRLKSGAYDQIVLASIFADSLKSDLYKVYRDKHLSVMFNPGMEQALSNMEKSIAPPSSSHTPNPAMEKKLNAGFRNVSLRPGNIGYIRFDNFSAPTEINKQVVDQAIGFVSGADALIIDLRYNGGGSPEMVQYISNYLFKEPTHLNSLYERDKDTVHYWTKPLSPNLSGVPIYILTSSNTFSGAEEFTYNLKNLKRAVIIGENTRGGAHPVRPFAGAHGIVVNIPFAKAINPISKTNWEGTGIAPDINMPAYQALEFAYSKALEQLAENNKNKPLENYFKWHANKVKSTLNKTNVKLSALESIAGKYGPVTIEFKDGELFYQRIEQPAYLIQPLSENLFVLEGIDYLIVEVVRDQNGKATELKLSYDNGKSDTLKKQDTKLKTM